MHPPHLPYQDSATICSGKVSKIFDIQCYYGNFFGVIKNIYNFICILQNNVLTLQRQRIQTTYLIEFMKGKLNNHHYAWLALTLLPACHTAKHTHCVADAEIHSTGTDTTAIRCWEKFAEQDTVYITMSIARYEIEGDSAMPRLKSVTVVDFNKTGGRKSAVSSAEENNVVRQIHTATKTDTHQSSDSENSVATDWRWLPGAILALSIFIITLILILKR